MGFFSGQKEPISEAIKPLPMVTMTIREIVQTEETCDDWKVEQLGGS